MGGPGTHEDFHQAERLQRVVGPVAIRLEPLEDTKREEADDEAEHQLLERVVDEEDRDANERDLPRALEHLEPVRSGSVSPVPMWQHTRCVHGRGLTRST